MLHHLLPLFQILRPTSSRHVASNVHEPHLSSDLFSNFLKLRSEGSGTKFLSTENTFKPIDNNDVIRSNSMPVQSKRNEYSAVVKINDKDASQKTIEKKKSFTSSQTSIACLCFVNHFVYSSLMAENGHFANVQFNEPHLVQSQQLDSISTN